MSGVSMIDRGKTRWGGGEINNLLKCLDTRFLLVKVPCLNMFFPAQRSPSAYRYLWWWKSVVGSTSNPLPYTPPTPLYEVGLVPGSFTSPVTTR